MGVKFSLSHEAKDVDWCFWEHGAEENILDLRERKWRETG